MENSKRTLWLILFSLIFVNISFFIFLHISSVKPHCDIDSKAYLEKAELIYKSGTFAPTPAYENLTYYVLGYPMFMALIYKIVGESVDFLIIAQILLALLAAFLIFLTARRLFNETVGIIAFALTCLNFGFLVFAQFILTETLLATLLIAFVERFSAYLKKDNTAALYSSALLLGLSVIVKPAALYYPIFLIPMLYFLKRKNLNSVRTHSTTPSWGFTQGERDGMATTNNDSQTTTLNDTQNSHQPNPFALSEASATHERNRTGTNALLINFTAAFLFPVLIYMVHNKAVFDEFKISKLESQNIYFWYYPNVLAIIHGSTSDAERAKLQLIAGHDNERIDIIKDMFWNDIKTLPLMLFVYVWMKNVVKTFLGLFTTNLKVLVEPGVKGGEISYFKMHGTAYQRAWMYIQAGATQEWVKFAGVAEAIWSLLRYFLCIIALAWLVLKRRLDLLYLFLSFIFYFSMITGHDGCARFRMMFEFILIILAALGLWLITKRTPKQNKIEE